MSEVTVCTAAVDDGAADDSGADDAGAADNDAAEDDYGGAAVLVSREQAAGNAMTVASRANLVNMMPPRPWATPERTVRQHVESCKDACPSAEALWHHLGQGEAGRPAISGVSRYHVWVVNGSVMESPRCKTRRRRYPRVDTLRECSLRRRIHWSPVHSFWWPRTASSIRDDLVSISKPKMAGELSFGEATASIAGQVTDFSVRPEGLEPPTF